MIPSTAHFVWLGPHFPWFNVLAVRSALQRGGFEKAVVHHDHPPVGPNWAALLTDSRVQLQSVNVADLCVHAGLDAASFLDLMKDLQAPAARSNVIRCLALAGQGGVYLDTDTVTVRALDDLRAASSVFCGQERVARPARLLRSKRKSDHVLSWGLMGLRHAFRLYPRGYLHFRMIENLYPLAVNNAVLASTAQHPFMLSLLNKMLLLPKTLRGVRFALGTHLLQDHVEQHRGDDVVVYPPEYFYPLPPEIADHWFRKHSKHDIHQAMSSQTRVVHWYGSTHRQKQMNMLEPRYVRDNAHRQMLSQLAAPFAAT